MSRSELELDKRVDGALERADLHPSSGSSPRLLRRRANERINKMSDENRMPTQHPHSSRIYIQHIRGLHA
jgi:hypothetical protein